MHQMVIAFLVLLAFAGFGNAYKLHRGRPYHKYGMLGEPKFDNSTSLYGEPEILWITQRLDNFNPADRRTWKQRYMVNAKFYKTGGPVFLLLGGEGEASAKWLSAPSHVMIMAQKYGALVFQLEHRFYGKSRPTTDLTTSNLAYLSSDQALADAAAFRNSITVSKQLDQNARWVVFGGSYSGSLAAWFKLKYPHLAVGAVASSAPMVALINFVDYIRVVRDSLGPDCSTKVKAGFAHLEKLAARREKWAIIDGQFKTCVPFDAFNQLNMQNFFQTMAGLFEGVVQYNKDERISGPSNITIDTVCDLMMSNEPFDGLVAVNDLILQSNNETCLDYDYDKFVRSMRNVTYDARSGEGGRQWMYQTCVEFGFFQSSDAKDQPFGQQFPVQLFIQQCRDIFDDFFDNAMLNRAIFRTNTQYGGIYPQLSNVTFPNGSIDPWHTLSILENLSDSVTANYIVGTAHCADMYPPAATDANTLTQARTKIEHEVAKWLQQ